MVARAGSYYGKAFKGERGVTQGCPLSPTIFNVVVDAVFRHWVNGLVDKAEEKGKSGRDGCHQSAVLYADDGMVVSLDPAWLQGAFNSLMAIFDRVDLLTNVGKTVRMVCHPCRAGDGNRTKEAYSWRITGVGRSYTERQRERVACEECGEVIVVESMLSHMVTRNGKAEARRHLWAPQTDGGPMTYKTSFPEKGVRRHCPVEVCPGVLETRTAMRVNFVHRHVHNTVVMLEEGNLPLPRCPRYDLQVPSKALNGRHLGTIQCRTGTERKRRRLAEAKMRENLERVFHAYGKPMEAVSDFCYLGRLLTATDDDWPEVAGNIRKALMSWGRLARVLGQEGADPKVSQSFYTAVTQQVLPFGAETWVLTRKMESALDAFQGRVARRLTGRQPRRGRDGKCFYPSLTGALKEAGVMRVRTSILWR